MSNRNHQKKIELILYKLQKTKYCSTAEMLAYLELKQEQLQYRNEGFRFGGSARTLLRDFRELRENYNINISYDYANRGYYIEDIAEVERSGLGRILELNELNSVLSTSQGMMRYIKLEARKGPGTDHLGGLLHAIKMHTRVLIDYEKYDSSPPAKRCIEPYMLREFKGRWYCLAYDVANKGIRTFGLDRMVSIESLSERFEPVLEEEIAGLFGDSFGIILTAAKAERVLLSCSAMQYPYLKSIPLHHSQKLAAKPNEDGSYNLELFIKPTQDFVMELLAMGAQIKVLAPRSLQLRLKEMLHKALAQYNHED